MTQIPVEKAVAAKVGDFAEFDRRAREGDYLTVVFLGGSLTWGARATDPQQTSYRALVGKQLAKFYPKARFTFWDAAVGGTGSQLAVFRLERDVIKQKPDLVFLDFTINDGTHSPFTEDKLASYESLVRRILLESGAPVVQVLLAVQSDLLPGWKPRLLDGPHSEIAKAYQSALADTVAWMRNKVQKGQADPFAMWPYVPDTTHPGDKGYALYAEAAWHAFQEAVQEKRVGCVPEKMLHPDTYMTWTRQRLSQLGELPRGWKLGLPTTMGTAFDFYMSRWLEDVVVAEAGAKPFPIRFKGSVALIFGEATKTSGKFQVLVDGKIATTEKAPEGIYSPVCADGTMHFVRVLAENLNPAVEHVLEIHPQLEAGQELRFESLCYAGGK